MDETRLWQAGLTRLKVKQCAQRSDGPFCKAVSRARRIHSAAWQKAPKARAPGAQKQTETGASWGSATALGGGKHQAAGTP